MNLLNKINTENITITIEKTALKFSYNLQDHEKELQISAGKIHLHRAKQDWKIENSNLILHMENRNVTVGEIKELFEKMVTA
jgi:hypothetical protein